MSVKNLTTKIIEIVLQMQAVGMSSGNMQMPLLLDELYLHSLGKK